MPDIVACDVADAPTLNQPRLEFIFFSTLLTVGSEIESTTCNCRGARTSGALPGNGGRFLRTLSENDARCVPANRGILPENITSYLRTAHSAHAG